MALIWDCSAVLGCGWGISAIAQALPGECMQRLACTTSSSGQEQWQDSVPGLDLGKNGFLDTICTIGRQQGCLRQQP